MIEIIGAGLGIVLILWIISTPTRLFCTLGLFLILFIVGVTWGVYYEVQAWKRRKKKVKAFIEERGRLPYDWEYQHYNLY